MKKDIIAGTIVIAIFLTGFGTSTYYGKEISRTLRGRHSQLSSVISTDTATTTASIEEILQDGVISSDEAVVLLDQLVMLQNELSELKGVKKPDICYTWTKDFTLDNPDIPSILDALEDCK